MAAERLHASCIAHHATPASSRQCANVLAQHAQRVSGAAQHTLRSMPPQQLQRRLPASRCRPAGRCGCMSTSASSEQQTLRAHTQEEAYDQLADRVLDLANPASRCAAEQWHSVARLMPCNLQRGGNPMCPEECVLHAAQVHGGDCGCTRQREEHSGSRGVAAAERTQGRHRTAGRLRSAMRHRCAHGR